VYLARVPSKNSPKQKLSLAALKSGIAGSAEHSPERVALLRQAAALDDVDALEELGMLLQGGLKDTSGRTIVARSAKASIRCYRRAAELGSAPAMEALATALSSSWEGGGRRPPSPAAPIVVEAIGWYKKAIRAGGDCYNLAVTYQNLGLHRKAVAWFRKSAEGGQIDALLPLARAELYGVGTARDVLGALTKLHEVAGSKSDTVSRFDREEAMRLVAQVVSEGWLAPRDLRDAVRWLRRAARLGSAAARGLLQDHGVAER
jgi:uncharacterized protein